MQLTADFQDFQVPTSRSPEELLWINVLIYVIEDAKRGSKPALAYIYDSEQFEFLCSALAYDAVAIRERILPKGFVEWIQTARKPLVRRTDNVDDTPVPETYYLQRKREREAIAKSFATLHTDHIFDSRSINQWS